jgi:hypothetical protein
MDYYLDKQVLSFVINDTIVYTSSIISTWLAPPTFSTDGKKMAFVERAADCGTAEFNQIVVCDFDLKTSTVQSIDKIAIPNGVSGTFSVNDEGDIFVKSGESLFSYDRNSKEFIESMIPKEKLDGDVDPQQIQRFQSAITKEFGDDSLENIGNINWIAKEIDAPLPTQEADTE